MADGCATRINKLIACALFAQAVILAGLVTMGCDVERFRMAGVVEGCEMTYSSTDAGIGLCHCSSEGVSPGAMVLAYPAEVEYGAGGLPTGCVISDEGSPAASAIADPFGFYSLRLPRGHYNIFHTAGCAESPPPGYPYFYSCEAVDGDLTINIDPCRGIGCLPNLYLYPSSPERLSVSLALGPGAALLTQFPSFDQVNCWDLYVEPGSKILQSPPGFLFYEARVGRPMPARQAWVLPALGSRQWIAETLPLLGWPAEPQRDFKASWEDRLDQGYSIAIYLIPQRWVDSRIGLLVEPPPDQVLRHWFLIERAPRGAPRISPQPTVFDESAGGFQVLEWGVIDHLSRD